MIKRVLKIAALALGSIVLCLVLLLAWVIYTEAGLQFAVNRLPEKMGKVTLKIEDVQGTIAGGFSARAVDVDHEVTHVRVEGGRARVNFWPLLVGRISVRRAYADLVQVDVKPKRDRPQIPPKFMPRLLSIGAERAEAKLLVIVATNGRRVDFEDVSGAGIVAHKYIRVFDGNIVYGVLHARALGELRAADPMQLSGEATTRMIIEGQPEWRADMSFDGDLHRLPLTGKLQAPFRADLAGELLELSTAFHWNGVADVHNFDLRAFGAGGALGIVSGRLDVGGEMNAFRARGPLTVPGLGVGPFDVVFEGNYEDKVVNATHYSAIHRATGSTVTGKGTIEAVDGGPKLVLHGDWSGLRWPLAARFTAQTPQLFGSPVGKYRLEGVWPYAITVNGELFVPRLSPMSVALRGALDKDHLRIADLGLGAFGGSARLVGEARWAPEESWTLEGDVTAFDPSGLRPGFRGALDFKLRARGKPFNADEVLDIAVADLHGTLRNNPASGSGRILLERGQDWTFDNLQMRAGSTRLVLDGNVGAKRALDLTFTLDADDLGLIAEGARGRLNASGFVIGTAEAPVVKLTAQGSGVEHGELKIDKLSANVDVDWRGQNASHADIAISRFAFGERELSQFNLLMEGTAADHSVRMDAFAGKNTAHLRGKGKFEDSAWKGAIDNLIIDDDANLNLQLDAPAPVVVSADSFKIDPLCLHGKVARLCGEGDWSPSGWSARADALNLPISTLTAGLTPKVEYQGTVNATASASSTGGAPFIGEARVDLVDAAIKHRLASGRTDIIHFGSGVFTLDGRPDHMRADLRLDAAARGLIVGRLRAERSAADMADWPMRGQLQMATGTLGFITLYVPEIDRVSGHFDVDLSFAGTLGRPSASGIVKLSRAELDLYQLNLALRQLEMEARIVSNNLEFTSTASAGAGKLASSGKIEWREGLPYGDIQLDGKDLRLVDVPEARIDASPDLDFHISGRDILVKGEVKLPMARIEPADLTNAVLPSADEVIVGETQQVADDPFRVTSEITMTLGDNVKIDTYGLTGHLTGSLTERTLPGEPTRATGELQVKDGQYTALARKLDIERGRLIFSGGLLADPAVDIRAVKEFPDVKAGVNVRGSLREPRLSFFSEPSIPQSQIVSLILAGGSLQSAQNANRPGGAPTAGAEVAGQAAALLASELGSKLGLPDISVESDFDMSNEQIGTSLVLGKYLSPRLYLSYGISLTESINTIKMRYTLDDHWTVKIEAGKERAADLVFTIEK